MEDHGRVPAVRRFNRFYTRVLGLLREGLLQTPFLLSEARLIFELGQRDEIELSELRDGLDLDAGYISRILGRLETQRLVERTRSDIDARRQVVRLTGDGRAAFRLLDERSSDEIRGLLSSLSEDQQRRLVRAMHEIEDVLGSSESLQAVVLHPPRSGDYGWIVERHGATYAAEFGWDQSFEALVARIVADFVDHHDPQREAAWIAELNGERVGCVFCMKKTDDVAQLRILLVEPTARGLGVGSRLVDECVRFARRAGYRRMMLWTNDVLQDARRIYERAGFQLVDEGSHHSFGHELVGQDWELEL